MRSALPLVSVSVALSCALYSTGREMNQIVNRIGSVGSQKCEVRFTVLLVSDSVVMSCILSLR